LYVVATPIGNLEDITLRAIRTLKEANVIACEDTRVTRTLLMHYGIGVRTLAYHERNRDRAAPGILARLGRGENVALVTDAGTPGISDPAAHLVALAVERGIAVCPIPGPSSPTAALAVSGFPASRYLFEGFLPRAGGARRERIARLTAEPHTIVLFESPGRTGATLADLAAALGPRRAVVAREITKRFEEFARATLPELAARYAEAPPRGEVVLVIEGAELATRVKRRGIASGAAAPPEPLSAPPLHAAPSLEAALRRAAQLAAEGARPSEAVARAAREFGIVRRDLYRRFVEKTLPD